MADHLPQAGNAAARRVVAPDDVHDLSGHPGRLTLLANEFASVHVAIDTSGNGPCLLVADPSSGRSIRLDPLELQAIAWAHHEELSALLAPAFKEAHVSDSSDNDESRSH